MTDFDNVFSGNPYEDKIRAMRMELNKTLTERDAARHALKNALAERDALQKSVNDYAANLGDIVTYGTTADVLDGYLQKTMAELDTLRAAAKDLEFAVVVGGCRSIDPDSPLMQQLTKARKGPNA